MTSERRRLPPITLLTILVEFFIIIFFSIIVSRQYLNSDPNLKIAGYEGEFLTNSATFVSYGLHKYGYFPLWQSTLATGEPVIENPFGFTLNPINIIPALIFGSNVGIRYSIVLTIILAGLGGWALGRILGFGSLGRVLLGLLLAGKGNMIAMINIGELQLGGSQAYIPWITAATLGILRLKHQRLPVILMPVMLTLMFFAGNIYFLLPMLLSTAALVVTHLFRFTRVEGYWRVLVDKAASSRLLVAAVLTLGLSAIAFLPIFLQQDYVGAHPREVGAGTYADIPTVFSMFFTDDQTPYRLRLVPAGREFYQSYVLPAWYALLAFIVFPILTLALARRQKSDMWKVVVPGLFMIVFCLLWGTGQNPLIGWLNVNVPFFAHWRYVGRILSFAGFWVAVLAVMQVDAFWRALRTERFWKRVRPLMRWPSLHSGLVALTFVVSLGAGWQIISQWRDYQPAPYGLFMEDDCITWLRQEYPDKYLTVWTMGYSILSTYTVNEVRHFNRGGDYMPLGSPSTLFKGDLMRLQPQYALAWDDKERETVRSLGYQQMTTSPRLDSDYYCVWEKPGTVPYAFTLPLPVIESLGGTLPVEMTTTGQVLTAVVPTPVTRLTAAPGHIGLMVEASDDPLVLAVQEVAYPGWTVEVDYQPAKLESVGGLIGVVLPPGRGTHVIYFIYIPLLVYVGAVVTVLSALLCIAYLLRLDRFVPRLWIEQANEAARRGGSAAYRLLTSPELFEPRHIPASEVLLLSAPKAAEAEPLSVLAEASASDETPPPAPEAPEAPAAEETPPAAPKPADAEETP